MLQYSLFDELILSLRIAERRDDDRRRVEELRATAPRLGFRRGIAEALVSLAMLLDRGAGEHLHAARATARG